MFTEREVGFERAFEIRIRNVKTGKTKNFSLVARRGTKDTDLPALDQLKDLIEKIFVEAKK